MNFDCKNGFLGVDYIGLDTLHGKIEHFTQIAIFFLEIKMDSEFQRSSSKTVDLLPPPQIGDRISNSPFTIFYSLTS